MKKKDKARHVRQAAKSAQNQHPPAVPPDETSVDEAGDDRPCRLPVDVWLNDKQRWILVCIVILSLLTRIAYYRDIAASPCVNAHHWVSSDMHFYHDWGVRIAAGDWLTDRASHRFTGFERRLASRYFEFYPERKAQYASADNPAHALISDWWSGKLFRTEPLYAYLIGITYKVFGVDVRFVFAWQLLLGIATNILIYLIARSCFGNITALVTAAFALAYAPLLFYEMVLIRATLIKFTVAFTLFLTIVALQRKSWLPWLGAGVAFGAGLLVKTIFKILLLATVLGLIVRSIRAPRTALRPLLGLAGGVMLCMLPIVYRNTVLGNPLMSVAATERYTFFLAHSAYYDPVYNTVPNVSQIARFMGDSGNSTVSAVLYTLRTHEDLQSYLKLTCNKLAALFFWYEWPNNANFYYYRMHSNMLQWVPLTFPFIGSLAFIGLLAALPTFRQSWTLYGFTVTQILIFLVARINARYKLPLALTLIPFAGFTVVQIGLWVRTREWRKIGLAGASASAVILLASYMLRPLPKEIKVVRSSDYFSIYDWYQETGGADGARPYLEHLVGIGIEDETVYLKLAVFALNDKDYSTAESLLKTCLSLNPQFVPAIKNLGVVYIGTGDIMKAAEYYEKAVKLAPKESDPYVNLMAIYLSKNNLDRALEIATLAEKRFPNNPDVKRNATVVFGRAGKRDRNQKP